MSKQITLIIYENKEKGSERRLSHPTQYPVLDTLRAGGVPLPALCGGRGSCGRCLVRFCGYVPLPTQTERAILAPDKLREGYRLACMAKPVMDSVIEPAFVKENRLSALTESYIHGAAGGCRYQNEYPEAYPKEKSTIAAADLGTTTIAMQLLGEESGHIWDTYTCLNPQRSIGMDVIERIRAGNEGKAAFLQTAVKDAIGRGLEQFVKFTDDNRLCKPELITIAANTTMGHLLMGYSTEALGRSPFEPVSLREEHFTLMGINAVLIPGISAFVGGDIVSGLFACGLHKTKETFLFVDLGTNAEMAIGFGGHIFCTAAAAGSAFEGSGEAGSGTDRIHAIARLMDMEIADETGLLKEPYFETGITVDRVHITQKDIRNVQLAKAAVRTGIHFLKEKAGLESYEQIDRVYLAGGFGFYLDKHAAVRIGLLPPQLEDKIIAAGNTSLAGAGIYGRKLTGERKVQQTQDAQVSLELNGIAAEAEVFNLAGQPGFEEWYIKYCV